jgi:hypothetical protein
MEVVLGLACLIVIIVAISKHLTRKRRERLWEKYKDQSVVEGIMKGLLWQGMSEEQLIDSWGRPVAKDHKVLKTKKTEIFKYNQTGKNRFASRVKLDNGIVVGWDKR